MSVRTSLDAFQRKMALYWMILIFSNLPFEIPGSCQCSTATIPHHSPPSTHITSTSSQSRYTPWCGSMMLKPKACMDSLLLVIHQPRPAGAQTFPKLHGLHGQNVSGGQDEVFDPVGGVQGQNGVHVERSLIIFSGQGRSFRLGC